MPKRLHIELTGGQIKSLAIARKVAKAIGDIESVMGIGPTKVSVTGLFLCPDVDVEELSRNPDELFLRKLLKQGESK